MKLELMAPGNISECSETCESLEERSHACQITVRIISCKPRNVNPTSLQRGVYNKCNFIPMYL